ncbi:uncharacterized protein isoform X2 [Rhodnius prolixus]|uniref:uncharacterized protein isoform X2 n=1 Tax=Rhodnius prolixus TaxID=13249 RepID=UPI003D18C7EA
MLLKRGSGMPVAPPPPPPPGPPLPPPAVQPAASDPKGRDLLLKSIRAGTSLKKTVTRDRSAPAIQGKSTNSGNSNNNKTNGPTNRPTIQSGSATIARSNGLGALFADGIPKLKPTRTNIGQQSQSSSLTSLTTANVSSLHGNNNHVVKSVEIGRKAFGTKNRGPPPQPPPPLAQKPNLPTSVSETTLTPAGNTIGNHTRSQSTVSLQNGRAKPGLLPKPPAPAPPPPNKRGGVSRAHSMRAPASPPIVSQIQGIPVFPTGGGLKGAPMFHASTDSLVRGGIRPKPPLKAPTSRPPPPPRSAVPPPPPPMQPPPPPPPLPPHRAAPPLPFTAPPPLPIRHSSMRNGYITGEFESKYIFHPVKDFPAPPPFRNLNKIYNSKTVKAPAPAPPATPQLHLNSKLYSRDSSNC